jgi:superoxide dismutase, Fe-Mn family
VVFLFFIKLIMHKIDPLAYSFDALEPHIDAQTVEIHYSKHHQTYADKLNAALSGNEELFNKDLYEILADIESVPEHIRPAVINHGGGVVNHNLYWAIMSPNGGGKPSGKLAKEIEKSYGSFEEFVTKFNDLALARFGSGWVWLVVTPEGELDIFSTPNQDSPIMSGDVPILGMDVWEHAYYLKYQNKRADYANAFWNVVNWEKVNESYERILQED